MGSLVDRGADGMKNVSIVHIRQKDIAWGIPCRRGKVMIIIILLSRGPRFWKVHGTSYSQKVGHLPHFNQVRRSLLKVSAASRKKYPPPRVILDDYQSTMHFQAPSPLWLP